MAETKTKTLDEQLHDRDESNQLYAFAETSLKCSPEQADTLARTMRHKFKWSGVRLLYHAENGEQLVAVDHVDQIREYLTRSKFDFLLPPPTHDVVVNGAEASIPGDLLDDALSGSKTAEGKICLLLGGNNADAAARTALLLKAERAKRSNGNNGGVNAHQHGTARAEMNGGDHATNPFSRAGWNLSKQGSVFKALGEAKTGALAASVGAKIGDVTWNKSHPANR